MKDEKFVDAKHIDLDDDHDDEDEEEEGEGRNKKKIRGEHRNMSEEQKIERREGNREHAKRSRVRKKFLLESLQQSVHTLQEENDKLKLAIKEYLPLDADEMLAGCSDQISCIATDPGDVTKTLDDPDYSLVKALQTAQQNFVISDPSMPDNPIVYASSGFLSLSGYSLDQVLGRNCRFLQGPLTDPRSVDRIRAGIERGDDTTVVLLNYRADGTTFWNQFFVAALRDGDSNIVNYLGAKMFICV
jgi:PAS domain S-box-containing protein